MSAYSLDLREKVVESVKKGVPKAETARRFGVDRAKDALIEAMGLALRAVSAQDARGYFVSCGYRAPAQ